MASGAISVNLIKPNLRSSFSGSPTAALAFKVIMLVLRAMAVPTASNDFLRKLLFCVENNFIDLPFAFLLKILKSKKKRPQIGLSV